MLENLISRTPDRKFSVLGTIKLGVIVTDEKKKTRYPRDVDHFVLPPELKEIYGSQPRELEVVFPYQILAAGFDSWRAQHQGNGARLCFSEDGKRAKRSEFAASGEKGRESLRTVWKEIECAGENCPSHQKGKCRDTARLRFILPKYRKRLGVWELYLHSLVGMDNIHGALKTARSIFELRPNGLEGVWFTLRREPKSFYLPTRLPDGTITQQKTIKWIVTLELHPCSMSLLGDSPLRLNAAPEAGPVETAMEAGTPIQAEVV
jgi:hypothetical protein